MQNDNSLLGVANSMMMLETDEPSTYFRQSSLNALGPEDAVFIMIGS